MGDDYGSLLGLNPAERARQEAAARAEARNDWYLKVVHKLFGPMSEQEAKDERDRYLAHGRSPKLLRVVEDYEA